MGDRRDRREFLKGACAGALASLLPLALPGLADDARAEDAPAAPPAPPPPPKLPTLEEVVAEWKPDALFARPGKKVLHFFPPDRREKMPKDMRPVEKVEGDQRVNRGQYREILKALLGKHTGDVRLARAAALLDPLDPDAIARVLGLLGKTRAYGEMAPFLDDVDRALTERAKTDRSLVKKLARLKANVARHRERVRDRGKRAKEASTRGR